MCGSVWSSTVWCVVGRIMKDMSTTSSPILIIFLQTHFPYGLPLMMFLCLLSNVKSFLLSIFRGRRFPASPWFAPPCSAAFVSHHMQCTWGCSRPFGHGDAGKRRPLVRTWGCSRPFGHGDAGKRRPLRMLCLCGRRMLCLWGRRMLCLWESRILCLWGRRMLCFQDFLDCWANRGAPFFIFPILILYF